MNTNALQQSNGERVQAKEEKRFWEEKTLLRPFGRIGFYVGVLLVLHSSPFLLEAIIWAIKNWGHHDWQRQILFYLVGELALCFVIYVVATISCYRAVGRSRLVSDEDQSRFVTGAMRAEDGTSKSTATNQSEVDEDDTREKYWEWAVWAVTAFIAMMYGYETALGENQVATSLQVQVYEHAAFRLAEAGGLGILAIVFFAIYRSADFSKNVSEIRNLAKTAETLNEGRKHIQKETEALHNAAQSLEVFRNLFSLDLTMDELAGARSATESQTKLVEQFKHWMTSGLARVIFAISSDIQGIVPERDNVLHGQQHGGGKPWDSDSGYIEHLVACAGHASLFWSLLAEITPPILPLTRHNEPAPIAVNTTIEHYCFAVRNLLLALRNGEANNEKVKYEYEFYTVFQGDPILWMDPSPPQRNMGNTAPLVADPRWMTFTERTSRWAKHAEVKLHRYFLIPKDPTDNPVQNGGALWLLCRKDAASAANAPTPINGNREEKAPLPIVIWDATREQLAERDAYGLCETLVSDEFLGTGEKSEFMTARLKELWGTGASKSNGQIVRADIASALLQAIINVYKNQPPNPLWPSPLSVRDWPQPSYVFAHTDKLDDIANEMKKNGARMDKGWEWKKMEKVLDGYHSKVNGNPGWKVCDLGDSSISASDSVDEQMKSLRYGDVFAVKRRIEGTGNWEWIACLGANNLSREKDSLRLWLLTESRPPFGSWGAFSDQLSKLFDTLDDYPDRTRGGSVAATVSQQAG